MFTNKLMVTQKYWSKTFFIFLTAIIAFTSININRANAQEASDLADLVVETLTINPTSLTYTFHNIGTAPYNGMVERTTAWLDSTGAVVASGNTMLSLTLPVGGTRNITVLPPNYPTAPSTATRLRLSFTARSPEKNSDNNTIEVARPLPDFAIESPVLTWNSGSYTIRNIGTANFYGRFNRRYEWIDTSGAVLSSSELAIPVSTINTGTTVTYPLPTSLFSTIPEGAVKLRITVDANSEIAELNETNNTVELDRVLPALDLRVYTAFVTPTQLNFSLINIGDTVFNHTVGVSFTWLGDNDVELGSSSATEDLTLRAGYSGGNTFNIENDFISHPPTGANRLRITVDPENQFTETNETNNSLTIPRSLPDLELRNFGVNRSSLFYRIGNNGTAEFVGPVTIRLTWLDQSGNGINTTDLVHSVNLGPIETGDRRLSPVFNETDDFVLHPPTGAIQLRVALNPDQAITESSFTNNSADILPVYPDFSIDSMVLGESSLSFIVRNSSDQGINARYTAALPIAFSWLDSTGAIIQTTNQSLSVDLRAGASAPLTISNTAVINPPLNGLRLRATVNPLGALPENILTNNSAEIARTSFPDLTLETANIDSSNQRVNFTVTNAGTQSVAGAITIKYSWLDGTGAEISSNETSPNLTIAAGASMAITNDSRYVISPPTNARQLLIEINPLHATTIVETNYENNTIHASRPLPDLTIASASLNQNNLTFTVANSGTIRYDHNTNRRLAWLDSNGAEISTHDLSGLIQVDPGARQTITLSPTARDTYFTNPPSGGVRLRLTLNANQAFSESNFDNNSFEVSPSYPDLTIVSGALSTTGASFNISNTGLATYSGPIRYQLEWLDTNRHSALAPSPILLTASSSLVAGGSITFTDAGYSLALGANRAFLRVTINPDNLSVESNYTNNSFDIPKPLPDLTSEISHLGDTTVDYRITNSGHWSVAENTSLTFEWVDEDGFVIGSQTQSFRVDLSPGATRDALYTGPFITAPPSGAFALRITINPSRTTLEENYDNNTSIEVPRAKPDLSIESALLTTSSLTYTVFNHGTQGNNRLVRTSYDWIDDNGVILGTRTIQDSAPLDPNTSYQVNSASLNTATQNFIRTPAAPNARLRVTVDYENNIAELNENNNSITLTRLTDNPTGQDTAGADENEAVGQVAAAADGVTNTPHVPVVRPRILPGNPLYFFKNIGHEINAALTFDDTQRANLRLRYANENLLEANFLATDGNVGAAAAHLQTYQRNLDKAQTAIDAVRRSESNPSSANSHTGAKLSARLASDQINHQVILNKFERLANTTNQPAVLESVRQIQKTTLDHAAANLSALPERLVEKTVNETLNQNGTPLRTFKNLEVLQTISENTPAKNRSVIERVVAAHEDQIVQSLENTSSPLSAKLRDYVKTSDSENILHLKINDSLSNRIKNLTPIENIETKKEEKNVEIIKEKEEVRPMPVQVIKSAEKELPTNEPVKVAPPLPVKEIISVPKVEVEPVVKEIPLIKEVSPVTEKTIVPVEPTKTSPIITIPTKEPTPIIIEPSKTSIQPAPTSVTPAVPVIKEIITTPVIVTTTVTNKIIAPSVVAPVLSPIETKTVIPPPVIKPETTSVVPTAVTMSIKDMAFSPATITIVAGGQITIQNFDKITHALTGGLTSTDIKSGGSVTVRAPLKPGTYSFTCLYHSSMKGSIVVK